MMSTELTLEDLEKLSKISIRTLRYYIQEGLLPGPDTRGKNASYSVQHLDRIKMIKRLKDKYLPLQQIKQLLDNMTGDDIHRMLHYQDQLSPKLEQIKAPKIQSENSSKSNSSALDYIRSLEQDHGLLHSISEPQFSASFFENTPLVMGNITQLEDQKMRQKVRRESWRKIIFTDGVELHVSAAREKEFKAEIQQLVDFARNLLEK
jgi:DNA-binding transcriptional MerR regulator